MTTEPVTVPCELANCRYHVDYRWARNCLLAYLDEQSAESLSVDEIAFLYRRAPGDVKAVLDEAMTRLRSTAIEQQCPRRFTVLETDLVCCVCESAVDEVPRSLRLDNHVYCSRECRDAKPPAVIALEVSRGLTIETILEWTFRQYRTLGLAEQSLGVPRWMLQDMTQRYLGRSLDSFFEKRGAKTLVRRTWHAPEWVDIMIQQTRRRLQGLNAIAPQTVRFDHYRERLRNILS